ncbi:DUF2269 family protein [Herbaspirillum lusitanum]|jgi:uncharacterized membrane protein|uniref:DUF2269 family protein n=1 Tax=Herbaspirillum lusitanum TaxID=213312 RepID=A0ABW9A430_9BURK
MTVVTWKAIHLAGMLLFLGNIILTAFWKTLADRSSNLVLIRFGVRVANLADIFFTLPGAIMLAAAGHFMAPSYGGLLHTGWMFWGLVLFIGAGALWLMVLIPLQLAQARSLRSLRDGDAIPTRYRKLARAWAMAGMLATLLPLIAAVLMVIKPQL